MTPRRSRRPARRPRRVRRTAARPVRGAASRRSSPGGGFRAVSEAGARDAATALSQIIGRPLRLQVPWARLIPLPRVADLAGGAERVVCALSLKVYGEIRGNLLLVLERGQVTLLLDLLMKDRGAQGARQGSGVRPGSGGRQAPDGELTPLEESALLEVGNIVAGAYLNSISRLLGVSLLPSIPGLALDMAGAVTDFLLIELAPLSEEALVLASEVREPQSGLRCGIFFLPDPSARAALEAAPARGPAEDPAA